MAITWRSLLAPDVHSGAAYAMANAAKSINQAFVPLQEQVAKTDAFNQARFKREDEDATAAVMGQLYGAKTPEELAALQQSGALNKTVAANGARIDQAAVQAKLVDRPAQLQENALKDIAFKDAKFQEANAPLIAEANILAKTDPIAFQREIANPSSRFAPLAQHKLGVAAATAAIDQAATNERARLEKLKIESGLLTDQSQRAASASTIASNAEASRSRNVDLAIKTAAANSTMSEQQATAALAGNPYADGIATKNSVSEFAELMKKYDVAGDGKDNGGLSGLFVTSSLQRREDLLKEASKVISEGWEDDKGNAIPIPKSAITSALLAANDEGGPGEHAKSFRDAMALAKIAAKNDSKLIAAAADYERVSNFRKQSADAGRAILINALNPEKKK